MRRLRFILILFLLTLTTACGAQAAPTMPSIPSPESVISQPSSTSTSEPLPAPTQAGTPTPMPTETLMPPLKLPPLALNAPKLAVWDGLPTYPGDSQPGYYFRVEYETEIWAETVDQYGFPAIGNRNIPYCVISPTAGRGLSPGLIVQHDVIYFPNLSFDVNSVSENGVLKFVNYLGGDGTIYTGFEVDFQENSDACLKDALTVLATLKSVPAAQATPQP